MVQVRLENVSKYYDGGEIKANRNIDLQIEEGEFFTFLGPSGCGKTTSLRLIAGLENPTEGRIYFDDEDVTDEPPKERNVAMVFQNYAIYPHMSVKENISYPLKVQDMPEDKIEEKLQETAEFLQITDLLDRDPGELSGGQRQRIALGRALIRGPSIFLLDEPLANLDAKLRVQMRTELKRLQDELGVTTIYVTHDQEEAMTMSDRIAVMNEGEVRQVAQPNELYAKPREKWVADFIGSPSMNLIECSLESKGGKSKLVAEGIEIMISEDKADLISERADASDLTFGLRPRDLSVSLEESDSPFIEGKIHTIEPLGEFNIVTVDTGEDWIKAKVDTGFEADLEEGVYLTFDESSLYIYGEDGELVTHNE